jgi:hypothetical protein
VTEGRKRPPIPIHSLLLSDNFSLSLIFLSLFLSSFLSLYSLYCCLSISMYILSLPLFHPFFVVSPSLAFYTVFLSIFDPFILGIFYIPPHPAFLLVFFHSSFLIFPKALPNNLPPPSLSISFFLPSHHLYHTFPVPLFPHSPSARFFCPLIFLLYLMMHHSIK